MIDLLILLLLVVGIVAVTAKLKISPFLALLAAAFIGAFAFRLPVDEIIPTITTAFGNTMGNIGLVILFGTMIGVILERSGGAIAMADVLIKVLGTRFPTLTMSIIGYIVSIPVFCDSGYIILNSLKKAMAERAKVSLVAMSIALMTGLYATHTMVPPTPGPLAAASNLNVVDSLGLLIGLGLVVAAVSAGAALLYANRFLKKDIELLPVPAEEVEVSYEDLRTQYGTLPSGFMAFLPILLPITLICLSSIAKLPGAPMGEGGLAATAVFVGTPVVALALGLLAAVFLLRGKGRLSTFNTQISDSIVLAAPILLITSAGAAFGGVLGKSSITAFLSDNLATLGLGIAVPFVISAALKTAQGSSTVAMVTTSAMLLPLLEPLGLAGGAGPVLAVLAIGAGAMVVSHANDSYFWVVSQFSRIPTATAYRTLTPATAVQGIAGFAAVWVLSLFLL
ncbi:MULTISPECIES: GntP family permease [unclassified Arthrobacter]|uniref:GntP family permease n=1 Tax=unclassified Arthrobacter TaxID=235627 RepID=UPI00210521A5|nr:MULTISPECIES: GntP family permease [unclassified Arthrobacter]MCQ1945981.1 GntP family permease [Arthrobacter sp. zg-Y1116]MCQ1985919.1 GntP family permease [Arthrobacter sp. zg-Y844]MCQ1994339.1 GntP family permease [Arthrobacter sp. zg-Y1171]UWX81570.1 GntP family permease [Arthrobacter sp. zg-Y1171]